MGVALGYQLDRWIFITVWILLLVLHSIQALVERELPARRFALNWTVHRLGPLSCLCGIIRSIDGWEAFQLYSPSNKVDYLFGYAVTMCMFLMGSSLVYSIVSSVYSYAQVKMSPIVLFSVKFVAVSIVLFYSTIIIEAYASQGSPHSELWLLFFGFVCFYEWTFFAGSAWQLRKILISNLNNPQSTDKTALVLRRINVSFLIATPLLLGGGVYCMITTKKEWHNPTPRAYYEPEVFHNSGVTEEVLLSIGGMWFLYVVWMPLNWHTCRLLHADKMARQGTNQRMTAMTPSQQSTPRAGAAASAFNAKKGSKDSRSHNTNDNTGHGLGPEGRTGGSFQHVNSESNLTQHEISITKQQHASTTAAPSPSGATRTGTDVTIVIDGVSSAGEGGGGGSSSTAGRVSRTLPAPILIPSPTAAAASARSSGSGSGSSGSGHSRAGSGGGGHSGGGVGGGGGDFLLSSGGSGGSGGAGHLPSVLEASPPSATSLLLPSAHQPHAHSQHSQAVDILPAFQEVSVPLLLPSPPITPPESASSLHVADAPVASASASDGATAISS